MQCCVQTTPALAPWACSGQLATPAKPREGIRGSLALFFRICAGPADFACLPDQEEQHKP